MVHPDNGIVFSPKKGYQVVKDGVKEDNFAVG